ncbi:MAG: hypothetical protein K0S47_4389 [Herbinix sp.]|nr:hypothetical protein [Herbinix sp.]
MFNPLAPINNKLHKKIEELAYKAYEHSPVLGNILNELNDTSKKVENICERNVFFYLNAFDSASPYINIIRKYFAPEVKELYVGDHLYVQRSVYTHHGLYYGEDKVIHYLSEAVTISSLEDFANGSKIQKKSDLVSPSRFSASDIIKRAEGRLGEDQYSLVYNNCEHFVRWCRNGD